MTTLNAADARSGLYRLIDETTQLHKTSPCRPGRTQKKLASAGLKAWAQKLLDVLQANPYRNPPPQEKLVGDLAGAYSRRINIQHRLVCWVLEDETAVKVLHLWTHYE